MHRTEDDGHVGNKFDDGSPGADSTLLKANMANVWTEELINLVLAAGLTPNTASESFAQMIQVRDAINILIAGAVLTCTGVANAYVVTGTGWTSYDDGAALKIRIGAGISNTGASTINVDSLGVKDIKWPNGAAIQLANVLKAGSIITLVYDGTGGYFQLATSSYETILANIAEVITARGSLGALATRLNVALETTNGKLKLKAALNGTAAAAHFKTVGLPTFYNGVNIASIAHAATGIYTVTFTTALATANYIANATALLAGGGGYVATDVFFRSQTTAGCVIGCKNQSTGANIDPQGISFVCHELI